MPEHFSTSPDTSLRQRLLEEMPEFRRHLQRLVETSSNSLSVDQLEASAAVIESIAAEMLPDTFVQTYRLTSEDDGLTRPFVVIGSSRPRCLLLAHHDTVEVPGDDFSFECDGRRVIGPGVHDDKGGLLIGIFALQHLHHHSPQLSSQVALYVGADEEIGSHSGRELIDALARDASVALGLEGCEPSEESSEPGNHEHIHSLKIGRKGIIGYRIEYFGESSHSGHATKTRADANRQLIHHAHEIEMRAAERPRLSLNIGQIAGGHARNQVSGHAVLGLEGRSLYLDELTRFDDLVRSLRQHDDCEGVTWKVTGGTDRFPFTPDDGSQMAFEAAQNVSLMLGIDPVIATISGGGGDICSIPPHVVRLDGLGGLGDNDHTREEWLDLSSVPDAIARVVGLMITLSGGDMRELTTTARPVDLAGATENAPS